jgi:hypothetical protein
MVSKLPSPEFLVLLRPQLHLDVLNRLHLPVLASTQARTRSHLVVVDRSTGVVDLAN